MSLKRLIVAVLLAMVIVASTACGDRKPLSDEELTSLHYSALMSQVAEMRVVERAQAIDFTNWILTLENQRSGILNYYVQQVGSATLIKWLVGKTFVDGSDPALADCPDFLGMKSICDEIALTECPAYLLPIKESLLNIYMQEIDEGATYFYLSDQGVRFVIAYDNESRWLEQEQAAKQRSPDNRANSIWPWCQIQRFRGHVYTQWAQALKDNAIDPATEGFTTLVLTP